MGATWSLVESCLFCGNKPEQRRLVHADSLQYTSAPPGMCIHSPRIAKLEISCLAFLLLFPGRCDAAPTEIPLVPSHSFTLQTAEIAQVHLMRKPHLNDFAACCFSLVVELELNERQLLTVRRQMWAGQFTRVPAPGA
eukprot:jgi/Ulvmu1/2992/UM015_0032.1